MEETKTIEASVSGETGSVSDSLECLPTVELQNFSSHDENFGTNLCQAIKNNTEESVEQYTVDVSLLGQTSTLAENSDGLNTDKEKEDILEESEQSLRKFIPDDSLLGKDAVVDEIINTKQQDMLVEDSMASVQQEASTILSLESSISGIPVLNDAGISSLPSVDFSSEKQAKESENTPNQFQDETFFSLADVQIVHSISSANGGSTENSSPTLPVELNNGKVVGSLAQKKEPESVISSEPAKDVYINRGIVDTSAPFESVKEAVTKFGGIVDWKAHKKITLEKRKQLQLELERMQADIPECKKQSEIAEDAKVQILNELDSTKKILEELRLNLEKAQTEEAEAKEDSDLAELRVKEMEQGIASESSFASKAQLDVAKTRYEAAVAELKSVNSELISLQGEYASLVNERDKATKNSEDASSALKEIEKTAEELALELLATKESLESAHAAHIEAEERRIGAALAREQDCVAWEKELMHAEEEVRQLLQQLSLTKDVKSELEAATGLLNNLKAELSSYMESKLNQESQSVNDLASDDVSETEEINSLIQELASIRKEHEQVKSGIEKAKNEVACLRVAASSLKSELDREKASLSDLQQREGMASVAVSSLEAELDRTKKELEAVRVKEKEAREKMVELPRLLQQAAQEADQAKSAAQLAEDELRKAKEEAEQAKASVSTIEIKIHAALKEIEAAQASQRLALAAIRALEDNNQPASFSGEDSPRGVVLSLEEYFNLSKSAHEAEEQAHERVKAAIAQIEVAKQSEMKSLERLNEAYKEMTERKESLSFAMEKSERAKEGKLGAEQELRKWRAEHEQRRRASDAAKVQVNSVRNPVGMQSTNNKIETDYLLKPKSFTSEVSWGSSVPDTKKRRKKRSLVPRFVLFLARRKSHQSFK